MGSYQKNDIKTAHDAVKYCTNTPNKYELQKFKCFFKAFVLVVYWELSQLRPSKMGAYLTNTDTNAAKYCTNTAKWDILQSTEYFLAFLEFSQQYQLHYHRGGEMGACQRNAVKTAYNAVEHCTNIPKLHKMQTKNNKMTFSFSPGKFGYNWHFHQLISNEMSACQKNSVTRYLML